MFTQTSRLSCTRPVTTLPHPPSASIPTHFGRCRSFHAQPNPLGPAPTGRGDAQTVRAGAATWDLTEWQMYQRESNFHARTLQLMHRITQTFKQEWDLYRAVGGASVGWAWHPSNNRLCGGGAQWREAPNSAARPWCPCRSGPPATRAATWPQC